MGTIAPAENARTNKKKAGRGIKSHTSTHNHFINETKSLQDAASRTNKLERRNGSGSGMQRGKRYVSFSPGGCAKANRAEPETLRHKDKAGKFTARGAGPSLGDEGRGSG